MEESRNIEFASLSETSGKLKESTLRTIVSNLNSDGGIIYIPMEGDGEKLIESVKAQIEESIAPMPLSHIRVDVMDMDERKSLIINTERGNMLPYYIEKTGISPEGVYVRKGEKTRKATEEEIRRLIIESFSTRWEDTVSPTQNLSFKDVEIPGSLLQNSNGKYTKLGLIFSDQNPYSFWISEFDSEDSIPTVTEIKGSVLDVYDNVLKKIENRYMYSYSIPYPMKAIKEILRNAIMHRDYSYMSGNVVNIYPDRIQFASIGSCPRPVKDSIIMEGIKADRNPKLRKMLNEILKPETTGVRAAIKNAKDNGFRIEFKEMEEIFSVTIRRVKPVITPEFSYDLTPEYRNLLLMESDTPLETERKSELDEVYSYIVINGTVTRKEIEDILGIHTTKAYYLLTELLKRKMIVQEKKGRSSYYHLP